MREGRRHKGEAILTRTIFQLRSLRCLCLSPPRFPAVPPMLKRPGPGFPGPAMTPIRARAPRHAKPSPAPYPKRRRRERSTSSIPAASARRRSPRRSPSAPITSRPACWSAYQRHRRRRRSDRQRRAGGPRFRRRRGPASMASISSRARNSMSSGALSAISVRMASTSQAPRQRARVHHRYDHQSEQLRRHERRPQYPGKLQYRLDFEHDHRQKRRLFGLRPAAAAGTGTNQVALAHSVLNACRCDQPAGRRQGLFDRAEQRHLRETAPSPAHSRSTKRRVTHRRALQGPAPRGPSAMETFRLRSVIADVPPLAEYLPWLEQVHASGRYKQFWPAG